MFARSNNELRYNAERLVGGPAVALHPAPHPAAALHPAPHPAPH